MSRRQKFNNELEYKMSNGEMIIEVVSDKPGWPTIWGLQEHFCS